jgi:hypothetical protein
MASVKKKSIIPAGKKAISKAGYSVVGSKPMAKAMKAGKKK